MANHVFFCEENFNKIPQCEEQHLNFPKLQSWLENSTTAPAYGMKKLVDTPPITTINANMLKGCILFTVLPQIV
jgi:hypothetical protein